MNTFKRIAASSLALMLSASAFSVTAASQTAPGYKLVNTYDEDTGVITTDLYVTGGYGAVGQVGIYYDTELLDLAASIDGELTSDYSFDDVEIKNFITSVSGTGYTVTVLTETNLLENLIDEEAGEVFFAWYSGATANVDAREKDVKIASLKFLAADGSDAADLEAAGTDLIKFATDVPSNKEVVGYGSGVYCTNEKNTKFRNSKNAKNFITTSVEFVGLDIEEEVEVVTITVVDAEGNPVEGAYVKIGSVEVQTDADGKAEFEVTGTYSVSYKYTKNDEYIVLDSGETEAVIGVPSKMSKPTVSTGVEKLTVRWNAPATTGGSDIKGYTISLEMTSGAGNEKTYTFDADETKATIEDLTGGAKYNVKIRAFNALGDGEYSEIVTATPSKESTNTGSTSRPGNTTTTPTVTKYTVTYDAGTNGKLTSGSKTESVESGKKPVNVPTVMANDGYTFLGWAKVGGSIIDPKNVVINEATTFVAQYEKKDDETTDPDDKPAGSSAQTNPFVDVKSEDWFYASVNEAYAKGLMNGVSATEFAPNGDVTRAMFVTVLYRMENSPENAGNTKFTDVEAGSWYDKAVAWASANGIVNGVSDTEFAPNNKITREQMAAMVYRYATYKGEDTTVGADISAYEDYASVSEYAIPAMKWVCGKGIIKGMTDTTLVPQGTSTRAQAATVFVRTQAAIIK